MAESKIKGTPYAMKSASKAIGVAPARDIVTATIDISGNPAHYRMIKGFAISGTPYLALTQLYCASATSIVVRVFNNGNSAEQNGTITVYYI